MRPSVVLQWIALIAIVALAPLLAAASGQPIVLNGNRWTISIQPDTLQVVCTPAADAPIVVSAGRSISSPVADLSCDQRQARWKLRSENVSVEVRLEDDALLVHFTATKPGSFTWPILAPDARQNPFILPMFEGVYVPTDDEQWAKFLENQGPLDTTGGLSMPFWGIQFGEHTLTYVLTNQFNNELAFAWDAGRLAAKFSHTFTANHPVKEYAVRIELGGGSPVEPAKVYRRWLIKQKKFVSFGEKMKKTPEAAKLLGAAHVYLWSEGMITRQDIPDCKRLVTRIAQQSAQSHASPARRLWSLMSETIRKQISALAGKERLDNYDRSQLVDALNQVLQRRDFYDAESWKDIALPEEAQALVKIGVSKLPDAQVCRLNALLLQAAFADSIDPVDRWGDGVSTKMLELLSDAGVDRLWVGSPDWAGLRNHPAAIHKAISLGYLIGPYDSFHSIHSPTEADTWETAQFGEKLYKTGAVVTENGTKKAGFKKKGYILNSVVTRPYVEKRVAALMDEFHCNSWFIDCDAAGELFDDYSPDHPLTQEEDKNERLSRMAWIRDTYGAVIGSEGGSSYAAGTIDFAHGIMTPGFGWGDPDLKDRKSRYWLGAYYPPGAPTIFFKQVPMKEEYRRVYADPRFRLPLFQTVFHDSVVTTHWWGSGSLKFVDPKHDRELLELLYNVPPLYHLNIGEWMKRKNEITAHYAFFSPLHREAGVLPMTDFAWLTDDRMVQRTVFGSKLQLIANFRDEPFARDGIQIPGHGIAAKWSDRGAARVYAPRAE